MKKTSKIISALLLVALTFFAVACEGTATDDAIKADLVYAVSKSDISSGILKAEAKGQNNGAAVTALVSLKSDEKNYDAYFTMFETTDGGKQNKVGAGYFARRDGVYETKFDKSTNFASLSADWFTPIASSDYKTEIDNLLSQQRAALSKTDKVKDAYSLLSKVLDVLFDLPESTLSKVNEFPYVLFSLLQNRGILQTGTATAVYDGGYRLSVDVVGGVKNSLEDLVKIGEIIDATPSITLDDLYNSKEFRDAFKSVLEASGARFMEETLNVLKYKLIKAGYQVDLDVIKAKRGENAFEYLYRFLNGKTQGLTIASLRVSDLLDILGADEDFSMKKECQEFSNEIIDGIKKFSDSLKVVYFIDGDLKLTRISIDFNLKESDYSTSSVLTYKNAHLKVNYEPQSVEELLRVI